MLQGYTLPRTPRGTSSLTPAPPWHYVGNCLAVEYEGNSEKIRALLPSCLELESPRCAAYFVASSAEFVGGFWLGKGSKCVIQRGFNAFVGAKAVGFSGGQFRFVV